MGDYNRHTTARGQMMLNVLPPDMMEKINAHKQLSPQSRIKIQDLPLHQTKYLPSENIHAPNPASYDRNAIYSPSVRPLSPRGYVQPAPQQRVEIHYGNPGQQYQMDYGRPVTPVMQRPYTPRVNFNPSQQQDQRFIQQRPQPLYNSPPSLSPPHLNARPQLNNYAPAQQQANIYHSDVQQFAPRPLATLPLPPPLPPTNYNQQYEPQPMRTNAPNPNNQNFYSLTNKNHNLDSDSSRSSNNRRNTKKGKKDSVLCCFPAFWAIMLLLGMIVGGFILIVKNRVLEPDTDLIEQRDKAVDGISDNNSTAGGNSTTTNGSTSNKTINSTTNSTTSTTDSPSSANGQPSTNPSSASTDFMFPPDYQKQQLQANNPNNPQTMYMLPPSAHLTMRAHVA